MRLIVIFSVLTIINVVFSTIKSIVTINGSKTVASIVSALYYGYYNIVIIYTVADFPLWQKISITFFANLVGVWLVKWGEERSRKDKLWKVEATLPNDNTAKEAISRLKEKDIPLNYIDIEKYVIVNCYCSTKEQSTVVKTILSNYGVKYFVNESKTL